MSKIYEIPELVKLLESHEPVKFCVSWTGTDGLMPQAARVISKLVDAVAVVVDEHKAHEDSDTRDVYTSLDDAIDRARIAAGIKAPPQDGDAGDRADEAHGNLGDGR